MLDEKDIKILDILKSDSKLSTQKIARKTLIPITTVHNRIKKLEKEGFIKKYTIVLDYNKLGKPILAFILANVSYNYFNQDFKQQDLANRIQKLSAVEEVAIVAGDIDLIIKIRVKSLEELNNFVINKLRNLKGINKTRTMIVLQDLNDE